MLARLLTERPPASDLAGLRTELDGAARTNARVGKVLEFYQARLAESDRYLLAAVSLFARPVRADAVLAVAAHAVFGSRLAEWTPAMVQAAVTGRLDGLASWHPDGTISAHPLVRDTFRRLVMDAAGTAADTSLAEMPSGKVTSRTDALTVVEAIELLLDAGEWQSADGLHETRSGRPEVWMTLPAARLGQRADIAFVATPARRAACADQLSARRLGYYLNAVGLCAMNAGDLVTAQEYMSLGTRHDRAAGDKLNLAIGLRNMANCLGYLGHVGPAREAATEALTTAQATADRIQVTNSHAQLGLAAGQAGDSAEAERHFLAADQMECIDSSDNKQHLFSMRGIWWAEWLARTGREKAAQTLTARNNDICHRNEWNDDLAHCDRILGRLALGAGDVAVANEHLTTAVGTFRDGDYLTELAITLADLAYCARAAGKLNIADRHAAEAITIAAPRGLVPAQAAALAARACIRADQAAASGPDLLYQGRDAADAALRLATRHQLAWHELDGLRAHAALDLAEGVDRGWAAKAKTLHTRLVPPGLDPDPLATVERLVAAQKAAEKKRRRT